MPLGKSVKSKESSLEALYFFLRKLRKAGIRHAMSWHTMGCISVDVFKLDEYWEINFNLDGSIEGTKYVTDHLPIGTSALEEVFAGSIPNPRAK